MKKTPLYLLCAVALAGLVACTPAPSTDDAPAAETETAAVTSEPAAEKLMCTEAGPQTPRDIHRPAGTNAVIFDIAPPPSEMGLCNVHFHRSAEHRAWGYTELAADGNGYVCNAAPAIAAAVTGDTTVCTDLRVGDTIEVHWVFSTCGEPGEGLAACAVTCDNPTLRVEAKAYRMVADGGVDFNQIGPGNLPSGEGAVRFLGSTTGPKYNDEVCSPAQVTWNVRPTCDDLNIASLGSWCADNPFNESKPQEARKLVENEALLSPIDG